MELCHLQDRMVPEVHGTGGPELPCYLLQPSAHLQGGGGWAGSLQDSPSPAPPTTFPSRDITWHRQVAAQSLSGRQTKGRD